MESLSQEHLKRKRRAGFERDILRGLKEVCAHMDIGVENSNILVDKESRDCKPVSK